MQTIDVARLNTTPGGSMDIRLQVSPQEIGELGKEVSLVAPLTARLYLTNTNPVILVEGTLVAPVQVRCSRCLGEFVQTLEVPISEAFLSSEYQEQPGDLSEDSSEEELSIFFGNTIELGEALRENLLAALPMKALCQAECRGLCPRCGQNLNEQDCSCTRYEADPRLQVLKKLLENKATKDEGF